jgi:PAS domain S-box-containing protein
MSAEAPPPPALRTAAELAPYMPALLDVLERAGVALVVIADDGVALTRLYANQPCAVLVGHTLDELLATSVLETIAPPDRPMLGQLVTSFRAGQPLPPVMELALLHRDGSHIPVELAIHLVRDGATAVYLVLLRGARTQQAELSLLEADRIGLVGAFASGVAHEINNPLTSVLLNLRTLRKHLQLNLADAIQPTAMRVLDDVTTGAERIASNVRALQTLATRGASGPIDLAAVVSAALRLAAPTLEPRAHVVRQIFPVRTVVGEEARIGQAVLAMLLFASSGLPAEGSPGARIVVCVEERAGHVVVEVTDNGRELTAEEQTRAFDPFFRSTVRGAGLGVGLGVARSVATALGGEVALAPRPGGGAVITMRVPL